LHAAACIALGLGAQTIMLVAYVSAMRDGAIDEHEAQFLRATRGVLWVAFVFIIVSGLELPVACTGRAGGDHFSAPRTFLNCCLLLR